MRKKTTTIKDTLVVYWSKLDSMWVSHSLRTDQIGVGDCVLDAMVDLMRGVNGLFEIAAKDKTVKILREAPDKVQQLAKSAEPLPEEIYEIAHKKVHGSWPETFSKLDVPITKKTILTADMLEPV